MSPRDVLSAVRAAGIRLEARGDRLRVEAPAGRLTPALRTALVTHKATLLAMIAPIEYVTLKGGLTLPLPALQLAWNLEERGFQLSLDGEVQIVVEPVEALTTQDKLAIDRWRPHLGAIVAYEAPPLV